MRDCQKDGPADEITSHLYSFGIRGKQFQYVEGNYPPGVKFHGRLTDNDVRQVMEKGGKVRILEPGYTQSDLETTRKSCADKQQIQNTEAAQPNKAAPSLDTAPSASAPGQVNQQAGQSPTSPSLQSASISVSSSPEDAEIYLDGEFVGNAPAVLKLVNGKHTVRLTKAGYTEWLREITAHAGSEVHLAATLEKSN